MGKKTRTRRTKWRRLSLGEASGPEEEDDEQQSEGVEVVLQQQSSDHELSGDEQQPTTDERPVTNDDMPSHEDNVSAACSSSASASSSATRPSSTHQNSAAWKLNTMPNNNANNHHHQYDKAQGRSNSPAACDQQQPHQQQSQPQAHQQHHQQHGKGQGYYNYHYPPNGLGSYNNGHANYQNGNPQQQRPPFRRGGPHRYGSNSHPHSNGGGSHGYGRANSWTNGSYNNTGNGACDAPKSHGIEKKIFNDEEYTKISTPRQEVLFKKGSIGKKRSNVAAPSTVTAAAGAVNGADNDDTLNGNAASSTAPTSPTGDGDSVHYNGCNDGASSGDASSTAGETSPDAASHNYDGAPMVCFPMYDMYGGYGGLYSGVLWQAYPGGPLVTAVPVPVPVQPVEWYRAPNGEVNYVYSLMYPTEQPIMEDNSPRSNSVESFQACSNQEGNSEGSMTTSENSSRCSTGPSSQGPASPQNELASPNGMDGIKGGGACDSLDSHKMAAVAGYIYHTGYAPAPVFAAGSGLGPSVESACDSASSSCSADQICRDVVPMTGPTHPTEETEASSSGSGKQVQSKLKSQDKQNHCGSGGEAGTGAGAGSDTLGRRKKRKKKRKSRPRDPLIPWVTDESRRECPEQTVGDDGKVSAQIPSASNAPPASASANKTTTTSTTAETTTTPTISNDSSANFSDLSPSDSSSELADLELDSSSSSQSDRQATQSPNPNQSPVESALAESQGSPVISTSPVELSADVLAFHQDSGRPNECSDDPTYCAPTDSGQEQADNDISRAESASPEPAIATWCPPLQEEKVTERVQNIDPPEATLTSDAEIDCEEKAVDAEHVPCPLACPDRGSEQVGDSRENGEQPADDPPPTEVTDAPTSFDSLDSDSLIDGSQSDAYEEDSLEDREDLQPLLSNQSDGVNLSDECHGRKALDGCLGPDLSKDLNEFECLLAEECGRSRTSSATSDGFEAITSDLIVDLLEQLQTWPEVPATAEAVEAPLSKIQASAVESGSDADSPLQVEEVNNDVDIYFDDTPSPPPPPPVQLWKTVILEESEPSSKQMSRQSSSDNSGSATLKETKMSSSLCYLQDDQVGPITSAVCNWLDSAPIQEQLISSTAELAIDESDVDEMDDVVDEVPKNEGTDPCTAPSSEDATASLDGPQRRVEAPVNQALGEDSADSNPQQQPDAEENPSASDTDASSVCDPAKYSIYYQLGISLEDEEDNESPAADPCANDQILSEAFKRIHSADGPTSWRFESEPQTTFPAQSSTDSGISSIESSIVPFPDSASASPEPPAAAPADSVSSRRSRRLKSKSDPTALSSSSLSSSGHTKRNSWRRTLRVLRAVHLLKKTPDKRKPLKSGQSCCAIQ